MRLKRSSQIMLAIIISLLVISCGQDEKKTDDSKSADSTGTTKTDSALTPAPVATPDAVAASPNLYKILSDTLGLRILGADYKPGDSSAIHSHPDLAMYVISGGSAAFGTKDGKLDKRDLVSGNAMIVPADIHTVKNVGKTELKVILVEVNRPMGASSSDASMNATKVAPNLYKLIADTMGIRILKADYKPGQSSALHSHPDLAMYVISGGNAEFGTKDGKKVKRDLKSGTAMITAADIHTVKNVGKTELKVLLVEVNRPLK